MAVGSGKRVLRDKDNFFVSRGKATMTSCNLFGGSTSTGMVASGKGRCRISYVLKTGSLCSLIGFHARASGRAPYVRVSPLSNVGGRGICVLPCPGGRGRIYLDSALFSVRGFGKRCKCCALKHPLSGRCLGDPIVGRRNRIVTVVRHGTSSGALESCTVDITCTDSLRAGKVSTSSDSLGTVRVHGTLPASRSRTHAFLFVVTSQTSSALCRGCLGSCVRRFPGDDRTCARHTRFFVTRKGCSTTTGSMRRTLGLSSGGSRAYFSLDGCLCRLGLHPSCGICGS